MNRIRITVMLILCFLAINSYGQYIRKLKLAMPGADELKSAADTLLPISPDFVMTGLVVRIDTSGSFDNSFIIAENDTFRLARGQDVQDTAGYITGNLIVFKNKVSGFLFFPGNIKKEAEFNFINASPTKKDLRKERRKKKASDCAEPEMIDQSVWREGLPEPDYERIVHEVRNIIIHHSATSNDLTDFTNVVRNIYLSHTLVNGWSDIGYNYLIAQDGTVFKGRDPGIYEQDNVMGAHFCSSNSGTMGICVLGNYMEIKPTQESMGALVNLLAWKSARNSLNPYGINPHPLNAELQVIAGHRDGCSTLCPGDSLYDELKYIRDETGLMLKGCGYEYFSATKKEPYLPEVVIFQDNKAGLLQIRTIDKPANNYYMVNMLGSIVSQGIIKPPDDSRFSIDISAVSPGIYFLVFKSGNIIFSEKVIIF
jgi:hypothetical protein